MSIGQTKIKTGLAKLDTMIGGFKGGELVVIAGRPNIGKTAFLQTIINNGGVETKLKPHGLYFTVDLPVAEARLRMDCLNARVDYLKATWWKSDQAEIRRLKKARRLNFFDSSIFIRPGSAMALSDLSRVIMNANKVRKLKVVMIESIHLGKYRKPEDVAMVCRFLKRLAKRLDISIITLFHSTQRIESDGKQPIPSLEDLKGMGAIKNVVDKILFVYREFYSQMNTDSTPISAQIIVAKNRNGRTGVADVQYTPSYKRFDNI